MNTETTMLIYKLSSMGVGLAFAYMGFLLFRGGQTASVGDFEAGNGDKKLSLKGGAAGTFFSMFGMVIICTTMFKGFTVNHQGEWGPVSAATLGAYEASIDSTAVPVSRRVSPQSGDAEFGSTQVLGDTLRGEQVDQELRRRMEELIRSSMRDESGKELLIKQNEEGLWEMIIQPVGWSGGATFYKYSNMAECSAGGKARDGDSGCETSGNSCEPTEPKAVQTYPTFTIEE